MKYRSQKIESALKITSNTFKKSVFTMDQISFFFYQKFQGRRKEF